METYGYIDNCLSDELLHDLITSQNLFPYVSGHRHEMMNNPHFNVIKWHYGYDVHNLHDPGIYFTENSRNNPQFTQMIFNLENHTQYTNYYFKISDYILDSYFNPDDILNAKLNRIKINMGLKTNNRKKHLVPHIDLDKHHLSMTLLLGESDGDHVVFEETDYNLSKKQDEDLTIAKQYSFKNNRLVFNFGHYHCNYDPVDHDHRLALNFVFTL